MDGQGEGFALGLMVDWTKEERKVKVAGRRLLPRPAASKVVVEKMNASLKGAC